MAKIIDGKSIAAELCAKIKDEVIKVKQRGIIPTLALINASDDPASNIYISKKKQLAESFGIRSLVHKFDADVSECELTALIKKLNEDENVHAILLQSPLPKHLRFRELINLIKPNKDVDGLTVINQGRLFSREACIVPCTPLGVLHLLHSIRKKLTGLHAVILGRSAIVGRPLSQLLLNADCTVTLLHSQSNNLPKICKTADILVSAIGKPHFIRKHFVKSGAIVIDVGMNRIQEDGIKKIVGDVDFDDVSDVAEAITPVPNGVGPMTVAYLMHNTLKLACCY
jgi:methylenetetrahydrofolate dehydrogenase (NADP+)/methenyltetrahydrofolate cyclohydrolase